MAYAIMRIKKIKSNAGFAKIMEHNYRLTPVLNADPNLQSENEELIELKYGTYNEAFNDAISKSDYYKDHKVRKNAVLGLEVLMTYTDDIALGMNTETWKKKNMEWLKDTFGENNIVSMTYHGDESTPHIHGIVIPMVDGQLNSYRILGNRHKMRELQDSYAKAMEPLGLERGLKYNAAKHTDIKKFYASLNKELEKKLPEINKNETVEHYKMRADAVYETANLKYLNEKLKTERKLTEIQSKHKGEIISLKNNITNLQVKVKSYEGFEREFGPLNSIKDEINEYRTLKQGLENLKKTSKEEANRVDTLKDYMTSVIKWEEERKKKQKEKEHNIKERKKYN